MMIRPTKKILLTTSLILAGFAGYANMAEAGGRNYASLKPAPAASASHFGEKRSILVPYGKSATVNLPTGMQDIIVSNPEIVDAIVHTNNRVLLVGKLPGQTNVFFYDGSGSELLNIEIRVERDLAGLNALIREHAPNADVKVQAVNNNILLSGMVEDAATSLNIVNLAKMWLGEATKTDNPGEVINMMRVNGNQQVQLKVRIVEMQRSVTKQMGIDFNVLGQIGDATLGLIGAAGQNLTSGITGTTSWTNSGAGALRSLTANLQALEKVGLVRTLAEPVLTTLSGETANFLSGGEFPLLTNVFIDDNGQLQREFEYKPFGVSLGFTPVVQSEGRITLNISTEVSEPTTEGAFVSNGNTIPAIKTRRANSVVELPAGGSLVMAGLIRKDSRSTLAGTPGLKDVPGVGALFRNRDSESTETELVIIVTPYLVNPTHPDKLQTPLDGFVPANDREIALLGRLNKVYGKNAKTDPKAKLLGPFGHVVD